MRKYIINSIEDLPRNARVGTSSLRRASQLRHARPDLQIIELRGNVETRLRKLYEGDYDAIVLASAGLKRLGFDDCISVYLSITEMLPAVGQAALAIETRIDDHRANMLIEVLNHQPTRYAVEAERAVLRSLGGGCAVPIAAFAHFKKNRISHKLAVEALVADVEADGLIRRQISGQAQDAEALGVRLAEMLAEAARANCFPESAGSRPPVPIQRPAARWASQRARKLRQKAGLRTAFRPSLKAGLRTMRRRKSRSWPSSRRGRSKPGLRAPLRFRPSPRKRDHRQPETATRLARYSDIASSSRGPPNRAVR